MNTLPQDTPGIWGAKLGPGQPAIKIKNHRYADFVWNKNKYPAYVSGGGFLVNWKGALVLQEQIPKTPITTIDDAFIGICMMRAGFENNVHNHAGFHSWGFGNHPHDKYDICKINEVVYFHKFLPNNLECFWPRFAAYHSMCNDPDVTNGDLQIKAEAVLCELTLLIELLIDYC